MHYFGDNNRRLMHRYLWFWDWNHSRFCVEEEDRNVRPTNGIPYWEYFAPDAQFRPWKSAWFYRVGEVFEHNLREREQKGRREWNSEDKKHFRGRKNFETKRFPRGYKFGEK